MRGGILGFQGGKLGRSCGLGMKWYSAMHEARAKLESWHTGRGR